MAGDGEKPIRVAFINVVATPHPPGVYERLFRYAANRPVQFWGSERAAITSIRARPDEAGIFTGQILTWVEIDPTSPAVNKERLEEVQLSADQRRMTNALGFNSRVFRFVLDVVEHRVSFLTFNEAGQRLSPRRALTIFDRVFSPEVLGTAAESVDVTIIPEDDALSYVLSIDRLDKVDILIKRPNDDDVTAETHEVLEELREQNAKRQEIILTRAAQTDGLELSEKNEKYARVASTNGHVTSRGRGADGEPDSRSTKEYPKLVEKMVEPGTSFVASLVEIAKSVRTRRARR